MHNLQLKYLGSTIPIWQTFFLIENILYSTDVLLRRKLWCINLKRSAVEKGSALSCYRLCVSAVVMATALKFLDSLIIFSGIPWMFRAALPISQMTFNHSPALWSVIATKGSFSTQICREGDISPPWKNQSCLETMYLVSYTKLNIWKRWKNENPRSDIESING